MKAVVQRVRDAYVTVDGQKVGQITKGLLVYLGVGKDDAEKDALWLAEKIAGLRIFEDDAGKMNLSVLDIGGGILSISQFTLLADSRKGKRPSYGDAADPVMAESLYNYFKRMIGSLVKDSASGVFEIGRASCRERV